MHYYSFFKTSPYQQSFPFNHLCHFLLYVHTCLLTPERKDVLVKSNRIQLSLAIRAWLNCLNFLKPNSPHLFRLPNQIPCFPTNRSAISIKIFWNQLPFFTHSKLKEARVCVEIDCVTQLLYHTLINLIWILMLQMKPSMQARGISAVLQLESKIHRALFIQFLLVIRNGLFGLVEVFVCQFSRFQF